MLQQVLIYPSEIANPLYIIDAFTRREDPRVLR